MVREKCQSCPTLPLWAFPSLQGCGPGEVSQGLHSESPPAGTGGSLLLQDPCGVTASRCGHGHRCHQRQQPWKPLPQCVDMCTDTRTDVCIHTYTHTPSYIYLYTEAETRVHRHICSHSHTFIQVHCPSSQKLAPSSWEVSPQPGVGVGRSSQMAFIAMDSTLGSPSLGWEPPGPQPSFLFLGPREAGLPPPQA